MLRNCRTGNDSEFFDVTEKKFSIQDEIIDGRPLYLDAQATTSMVSKYLSVSIAVCGVEGWGFGVWSGFNTHLIANIASLSVERDIWNAAIEHWFVYFL